MEPIPALEVNEVRFDETVDVVVVGLGAAGSPRPWRRARPERTCWRWSGAWGPAGRRRTRAD